MKCNRCERDNCRSLFEHVRDDRTAGADWQATARALEDCAEATAKRALRLEMVALGLAGCFAQLDRAHDAVAGPDPEIETPEWLVACRRLVRRVLRGEP